MARKTVVLTKRAQSAKELLFANACKVRKDAPDTPLPSEKPYANRMPLSEQYAGDDFAIVTPIREPRDGGRRECRRMNRKRCLGQKPVYKDSRRGRGRFVANYLLF